MGLFKVLKERKKYLTKFEPEYLKEFFNEMYDFYESNEDQFVNIGLLNETQAKFRYNPKRHSIDVAFECSRPNRVHKKFPIAIDWIINLFYIPVNFIFARFKRTYKDSDIKFYTHAGFTIAWLACVEYFENTINCMLQEHPDVTDIRIYGWSYGGAMAQFAYEFAKYKYEMKQKRVVVTAMTIGAPKIFFNMYLMFWRIKDWLRFIPRFDRLIMFKNKNDIVTTMPLKILGFNHVVPCYEVGDKFNIFKFFNPMKYHLNTTYKQVINDELDERIFEKQYI